MPISPDGKRRANGVGVDAALFDFDGTLVDTMPLHFEAYRRVLGEVGIELSPRDFYSNVGGPARETIPRFLGERACALSTDEIHTRKKAALAELLRSAEIPQLAAARLLPLLHGRARLALVSSGARPGLEAMLDRLGWRDMFEVVVTGEDTPRGKPAPDPFLRAAERLGVAPSACLAFEDTDDGVASARAAGMQVFDVRRAAPPRRG